MQLITRFFTWFSNTFRKQSGKGKLAMGCLTLAIVLCIISVPIAILSPSTPTPETPSLMINTPSSEALVDSTVEIEPTQINLAVSAVDISVPTNTSRPTNTPIPSPISTPTNSSPLIIHFIDVGQGDSILIQSPDGKVGLIDGGIEDSGVTQYLQNVGISHLDLVIATHPHEDHIGGLVGVLATFPVDKVVTNGVSHTTLTYEHFLDAIALSQADYVEAFRGDTISLGDLNFAVLSPIDNTDEDLNNGSLVLRLVYGKVSFLFTGDIQEAAEENILASGLDVSATILKVAHHGSRTGSSMNFLNAVRPQVAIYSAGAGNDYGHPHPETIDRLKSVGASIYGTDINGTIIITTDGNKYTLATTKQVPTQTPTPEQPTSAPQAQLSISVVSLTSPIAAGGNASLTVNTLPGAACTITVYYKSGPSQAAGLGSQTAGGNGSVTWSWKVGTRTTPGTWSITVTAALNGQSTSIQIPFEVR
jgi:competence protein ComEC